MTAEPLLSSLRAQTYNLPSDKEMSPCLGDGVPFPRNDGSSAMTLKGGKVVRFGEVCLPASKSESNRALMVAAYEGFALDFQNLSDSRDTLVLAEAIRRAQRGDTTIDIADCGTAARFMTTFLACHEGEWLLTGTERMKQRPIKPLVEALAELGTDIHYAEKQGFLPLQIHGKPLSGGKVSVDMTLSSQFVSSLLLAAPVSPKGLELELLGSFNSIPYLDMTLSMMRHFGAEVEREGRTIFVNPKPYQSRDFEVSADWSAASYWYEMAALSDSCEIRLYGLAYPSLQGDSMITDYMAQLGVSTEQDGKMFILKKMPMRRRAFIFDFSSTPDLFPTMAATCAGLQVEARFSGIRNLGSKESDRVGAMQMELSRIGARLERLGENEAVLVPSPQLPHYEFSSPLRLNAHNDHRIVMALAPLSMKIGSLSFDHPEVVAKSYPKYWQDASFLSVCR